MSKGKKVRVVITVEENGGVRVYDSGSQPSKSSLHDEFTAVNAVADHLCILFSGNETPKEPTWMSSDGRVTPIKDLEDNHLVNIVVNSYAIASKKSPFEKDVTRWCLTNTPSFERLVKEVDKRELFGNLLISFVQKFGTAGSKLWAECIGVVGAEATFIEKNNGWRL